MHKGAICCIQKSTLSLPRCSLNWYWLQYSAKHELNIIEQQQKCIIQWFLLCFIIFNHSALHTIRICHTMRLDCAKHCSKITSFCIDILIKFTSQTHWYCTLLKIRVKYCTKALPIARRGKYLLQWPLVYIGNTSSFLCTLAMSLARRGNIFNTAVRNYLISIFFFTNKYPKVQELHCHTMKKVQGCFYIFPIGFL